MILRVLGEGQYELAEERIDDLNSLDEELVRAVDSGDEAGFAEALSRLIERIRSEGSRVPDDYLGPSDLVLPGASSSLAEVRAMLGEEGLIPG